MSLLHALIDSVIVMSHSCSRRLSSKIVIRIYLFLNQYNPQGSVVLVKHGFIVVTLIIKSLTYELIDLVNLPVLIINNWAEGVQDVRVEIVVIF